MEIQQLALVLTEQDLNALVDKHLTDDVPVEKIEMRLSTTGLQVKGEFPLFVNVRFETAWELGIRQGKVTARLDHLKAFGLPVNVFRSMVVKFIAEAAKRIDGLECDNDVIIADIDRLAAREGIQLQSNLRSIECQDGRIVVKASC
jgi:hypothetical protein